MEGCSGLSWMWQCAGDKVNNQAQQQPFCYLLLLFFRDDDGYSSAEVVLHVKSHALIPAGCFLVAADGSSVDKGSTEPVVVMESVTCQVTSCWWQHGGWGKEGTWNFCDMSSLETAENQMVWNSYLWARRAGDGWIHMNYCISQMEQRAAHNGREKQISAKPLSSEHSYLNWNTLIFFIRLHIDYCIDLLERLVKHGSCNCLSS